MALRSGGRFLAVLLLVLVVAACGDDDADVPFTTTSAGGTTVTGAPVETTTTVTWGQEMAPGAQAMLEGARVLLREDFQDGDTAGWQIDSGWYLLESGERRMLAAGSAAWAWYEGGLDWERYGARAAVRPEEGSLALSVAVGPEGRYLVHLDPNGVYLLKDAPWGTYSSLGSAQPLAPGEPHVVAVGLDGGHLQVYLDGVLHIDASDPMPLPGGTVGLGVADDSSGVVDNILVVSLGGPLPQIAAVGVPADQGLSGMPGDGAAGGIDAGPAVDPALPDLRLAGVEFPGGTPVAGEPFRVALTVANDGGAAAEAVVGFRTDHAQCESQVQVAGGATAVAECEAGAFPADGTYSWEAIADPYGAVAESNEDNNSAGGTLVLGEEGGGGTLPNLQVAWAAWEPDPPAPNEPIRMMMGIVQTEGAFQGDLPVYRSRVTVNEDVICDIEVPPGVQEIACDLPGFGTAGTYGVSLSIDAYGAVAESEESDNYLDVLVQVVDPNAALPNLSYGGVTFAPSPPVGGEPFTATIAILGEPMIGTVTAYTIRLLIDEVVVCSADWQALSGNLECPIAGMPGGFHTFAVNVDADGDVEESSENDNGGWGGFTITE